MLALVHSKATPGVTPGVTPPEGSNSLLPELLREYEKRVIQNGVISESGRVIQLARIQKRDYSDIISEVLKRWSASAAAALCCCCCCCCAAAAAAATAAVTCYCTAEATFDAAAVLLLLCCCCCVAAALSGACACHGWFGSRRQAMACHATHAAQLTARDARHRARLCTRLARARLVDSAGITAQRMRFALKLEAQQGSARAARAACAGQGCRLLARLGWLIGSAESSAHGSTPGIDSRGTFFNTSKRIESGNGYSRHRACS